MAAKNKPKSKPKAKQQKPGKKAAHKPAPARKSFVSKKKAVKPSKAPRQAAASAPKQTAQASVKKSSASVRKAGPKVVVRPASKGRENQSRAVAEQRIRSREYASAVHAYEAGLKLMHAEEYERAIKAFRELIVDHSDEPEIQERARVLMQASEKKLQEKARMVLRSADDHYNMGIAELNRRELDAATQHLQHALKIAPKAEHILYAMAAVNALKGNRDDALSFLKQSIHYRAENRFMATRDTDFESLIEDPDFKALVASPEK